MLFYHCWDGVENNWFSVCVSINMQRIVCNISCRGLEAVIYCLHHCVRARLRAMLHLPSTMARDSCVGLVCSNEQASIWPSKGRSDSDQWQKSNCGLFFFLQQLQCAWLR